MRSMFAVTDWMLATISSMDEEEVATPSAWRSIWVYRTFMFFVICSTVALDSVTEALWFMVCCLRLSMLAAICRTAPAVSSVLDDSRSMPSSSCRDSALMRSMRPRRMPVNVLKWPARSPSSSLSPTPTCGRIRRLPPRGSTGL